MTPPIPDALYIEQAPDRIYRTPIILSTSDEKRNKFKYMFLYLQRIINLNSHSYHIISCTSNFISVMRSNAAMYNYTANERKYPAPIVVRCIAEKLTIRIAGVIYTTVEMFHHIISEHPRLTHIRYIKFVSLSGIAVRVSLQPGPVAHRSMFSVRPRQQYPYRR